MKILHNKSKNEGGFILVVSMVMLVVLSLFGIFALNTTTFELQIARNDNVYKDTTYKAESGGMLAVEVLEQNIYCSDGFDSTKTIGSGSGDDSYLNGPVAVTDVGSVRSHGWTTGVADHSFEGLAFYLNQKPWVNSICNIFMLSQPNISFPISSIGDDFALDTDRTDVYLGGAVKKLPGGALQMAAGYERLGKSSAAGGAMRTYDIISKHRGTSNSEAVMVLGWDHLIGTEYDAGSANYCN